MVHLPPVLRQQFISRVPSFVFNKFVLPIVVTIAVSCSLLFLITKQKSLYLPSCNPFPFENYLEASANNKSNIQF